MKRETGRLFVFAIVMGASALLRAQSPATSPPSSPTHGSSTSSNPAPANSTPSNPGSIDDQLTALQQLVAKDAQATPGDNRASGLVLSIRAMVGRKDYNNAINLTNNLLMADSSDAAQKAVATLTASLRKAQQNAQAQLSWQIKPALDDAAQAIRTAKDPKDLDAILTELSSTLTQIQSQPYSPDRQGIQQQIQAATRFVQQWQSYLVDHNAGNTMQASNDLRNLTFDNGNVSFMPIPRSELLDRAMKEAATENQTLSSNIKLSSFDDIPAALSQLQTLQRSGNFSMEMNNLTNALQNLQSAYLAYEDKNYTGALQALQNNPYGAMDGVVFSGQAAATSGTGLSDGKSIHEEIRTLKDTLLLEIAQGLLSLPDAPAPKEGEQAKDYLLRLAALEEKNADWATLLQVLTVYQQTSGMFNLQPWLQEDLSGLHCYLIGEKLEAAGQNLDAIRAYRQSLATLGKFFPADPATTKLKEMQKQFPDVYQQALQQPIEPVQPRGPGQY